MLLCDISLLLFFFNHPPTTEIYTLSLHDALPIFIRLAPTPDGHAMLIDRLPSQIVWLAEPGAGGGGGGGGNQQKEPIKKAELPGKEKITVPVQKPPEPKPIPEVKPPEEDKINIPAVTMSAANETSP